MGVRQFARSLQSIASNPHVDRQHAFVRHLTWQLRKALGLFPFEQRISASRIVAGNPRCGVSALIYSQGLYNYNNMSLLRWLVSDGGLFVDVGANIGPYTLIASEQLDAKVFAFEPHPATFRELASNVALNHRSNVVLFQLGLSDRNARALFTDDPGSAGNHLTYDSRGAIEIEIRRAEDVFDARGATPRYAKIDVEGFEREVIAGFGRYLDGLDVLFVEVNGLSAARGAPVHDILEARGFAGPYACDFDARRLSPWRPGAREDCIYISAAFQRAGLRVVDTQASRIAPAARSNV